MRETIDSDSTTTEPHHKNATAGLHVFYWDKMFALDSAFVKAPKYLVRMEAF